MLSILNCGDVVLATADAPALKPEVRSVVRRSGNRTLRLMFTADPPDKQAQQPILDALQAMDSWVERANPRVVCLNVTPAADYEAVCSFLADQEAQGVLEYETCEERVPGSFDDRPDDAGDDDEQEDRA